MRWALGMQALKVNMWGEKGRVSVREEQAVYDRRTRLLNVRANPLSFSSSVGVDFSRQEKSPRPPKKFRPSLPNIALLSLLYL